MLFLKYCQGEGIGRVRQAGYVADTATSEMHTKFWWEKLNTIGNLADQLDGRIMFTQFVEKQGVKLFVLIQLPTPPSYCISL